MGEQGPNPESKDESVLRAELAAMLDSDFKLPDDQKMVEEYRKIFMEGDKNQLSEALEVFRSAASGSRVSEGAGLDGEDIYGGFGDVPNSQHLQERASEDRAVYERYIGKIEELISRLAE